MTNGDKHDKPDPGCLDALDVVGFTAEERRDLKSILAAILYLSNVNFSTEDEHADVKDTAPLKTAAEFLGVGYIAQYQP